jgi:transcriptional regulator NrdR family protein
MVCIYCGQKTQVVNSRFKKRNNETWRRRQCSGCLSIFTTYETTNLANSVVVQYSPQRLEPLSRDRLFVSIYESCRHRPQALQDATSLTQTIISKLLVQTNNGIIERDMIVSTCADTLGAFDVAAATMYRAYHMIARASQ